MVKMRGWLPLFFGLLCLGSCQEKPVAGFTYDCSGGACLSPVIVNFLLDTENAERVQWDFGDGQTSNFPSPQHEYGQPGTYAVTLTVFNGDRSDEIIQEIEIERPASRLVVRQLEIAAFADQLPDGTAWDPGEGGTASFPDLYVTFSGNDIDYAPNLRNASLANIQSGQLPVGWTFNPPIELGDINGIYRLNLLDRDAQTDPTVGYVDLAASDYILRKYYTAEIELVRIPTRMRLFVEWR